MNTIKKSQMLFPDLFPPPGTTAKPPPRRRLVFGIPRKPGDGWIFFVSLMVYLVSIFPSIVYALPSGGTVQAGDASIHQPSSENLVIQQSTDKAIIDWRSFGIQGNEQVDFQLPSASGVTLNRVTGGERSDIFGKLTSNGNLMLINPNGILFGAGAQIDVHGLVASTSGITNEDFLAGRYDFNIPSTFGGVVVNRGRITVSQGGLVALVAPGVQNSGVIDARLGRVALASGETFTLDLYGDQLVNLGIDSNVTRQITGLDGEVLSSLVTNSGSIYADGGTVRLDVNAARDVVDNVINMSGIIQARSVEERNGTIILRGGDEGQVNVSGTLDVSGINEGETGGTVHVFGDEIGLFQSALLDASGDTGGGTILVGGDYQGQGAFPTASETFVDNGVSIFADALSLGDGGRTIFWADRRMRFFGSVFARGGRKRGNGGFVEVSGKEELFFDGSVNTSAPNGLTGTLLLDPTDIIIADGAGTPSASGAVTFTTFEKTLEANSSNTTIQLVASNSITLNNLSDNLLDLSLNISGALTMIAGAGGILFQDTNDKILADQSISLTATGGDLTLGSLTSTNGDINLNGKNLSLNGSLSSGGGTSTLTASEGITLNSGFSSIGNANLTAGTGILLNSSFSSTGNADLTAGSTLTLANGITVSSDGTLSLSASSGITAQGAVTLNAASGVTLNDSFTSAGAASIDSDSNDDGTGSFTVASGKTVSTGNNSLTIVGGDLVLNGSLNSGTGTTTILSSNGGTIGLGNGTGDLKIAGDELGRITANNLVIGNATNGSITVDNVTAANSNNAGAVTLNANKSGSQVTFQNSASTFNALTVNAGSGISANAAITTDTGNLTLNAGAGAISGTGTTTLNSAGNLTLNNSFSSAGNAALTATGSLTLANGISVSSDGTLALSASSGINAQGEATVSSANGLTLNDSFTSAGTTSFDADSDDDGTGSFTVASGKTVSTDNNSLSVVAGDVVLNGSLNSGTGATTILTSNGGSIGLGDTAGTLTVGGSELQNITAGTLVMGDGTNGNITVDNISESNSDNIGTVTLNATKSGSQVTFNNDSTFNALTANAENGVTVSGNLTTQGTTAFNSDSDGDGTGSFTLGAGKTLSTANNSLSITTSGLNINGTLTSGTGSTSIEVSKSGDTIGLGDATGTLSITGGELDNITAGSFTIGGSNNGGISVDNLNPSTLRPLTLVSSATGNDVTFFNSSIFDDLTVTAGGSILDNGGTAILNVSGVSSFTGNQGISLSNSGNVFAGLVTLNSSSGNAILATNGALNFGDSNIGGTFSLTAGNNITLTGGLFTSSASASAVTLTSTGGGIFDGDTTGTLDIDAANGGLVVDSVTGFGTELNPIETKVASVDIDNTTSGDVSIFESDGLNIIKINQAGPGDVTVSYFGTLTGEDNVTVTSGTKSFVTRNTGSLFLPEFGKTVSELSTERTVSVTQVLESGYFSSNQPFAPDGKTVTQTLKGPVSGPFVMDVFNENFELIEMAKNKRGEYAGLQGFSSFWGPLGIGNTEVVKRPAKKSLGEEARLKKKKVEKRKKALKRKKRARRVGDTARVTKRVRKKQEESWLSSWGLGNFFK